MANAGYFTTAVPDAGTVLNLDQPDYDAFVSQLPKSVHKDYRRQRNQAAARKITIQAEQTPQSPREMLRLTARSSAIIRYAETLGRSNIKTAGRGKIYLAGGLSGASSGGLRFTA